MADGSFVELSGGKVFVRHSKSAGSAHNIVLLHGYAFSSRNWEDIGAFSRLNRLGYSVFAPDYPGFGQSEDIPEFSIKRGDVSNSRYFVRELMNALKLDRTILLGPSMGGGMAILSSALYPERFEKLILVGPAWFSQIDVNRINLPKLFIWGENDDVAPYQNVKDSIHPDGKTRIEIVKGAGHPVYLDRTGEFFSILENFLTSG